MAPLRTQFPPTLTVTEAAHDVIERVAVERGVTVKTVTEALIAAALSGRAPLEFLPPLGMPPVYDVAATPPAPPEAWTWRGKTRVG